MIHGIRIGAGNIPVSDPVISTVMLKRLFLTLAGLLSVCHFSLTHGGTVRPYPAPEWEISEWLNGDPGSLEQNRGRVILIDFFQLWCPGCNRFSIPLFEKWQEKYAGRDDLLMVSIHTVFEGHASQSPERLKGFVRENGMNHPVGIDAYARKSDDVPITMRRYRTGGTPNVVIVDKQGRIRFRHLGSFEPGPVEALIDTLLAEDPGGKEASPKRNPHLSGEYRLRFHQKSKSCGPPLPEMEILATIAVFRDHLVAEFPEPFLGLQSLSAEFQPDRLEFHSRGEQRIDLGPAGVWLTLEVWGRFFRETELPELDFEIWFRKLGEDPDWDCEVTAEGQGKKVKSHACPKPVSGAGPVTGLPHRARRAARGWGPRPVPPTPPITTGFWEAMGTWMGVKLDSTHGGNFLKAKNFVSGWKLSHPDRYATTPGRRLPFSSSPQAVSAFFR